MHDIDMFQEIGFVTQGCVQPNRGYFEWTEQIISINPYKLIHFFCYDIEKYIYFFKIVRLYTPLRNCVQPDWGYFFLNRTKIAINP
jgi:hypothetical protein